MENNEKKERLPTASELERYMIIPMLATDLTVLLLQLIIYCAPIGLLVMVSRLVGSYTSSLAFWILVAPVYVVGFLTTAAVLSIPFQRAIIKGIFPRDSRFPIYAARRCYGICWTSVYYSPFYNVVLSFYPFRWLILRLFGYRGSNQINLYPDSWIRDLPLLRIEEGVYISNRCMLGTNVSMIQGFTMVGNVTVKKGALIGADSKVGLGSTVGERTEFGIECVSGLHVKIGSDCIIGSCTELSHYSKIGNNTKIGIGCYIGTSAVIGDNLVIPNRLSIPDRSMVLNQSDVDKYISFMSPKEVPSLGLASESGES